MSKMMSTNMQMDVAIAALEALNIDADEDDNIWAILEFIDTEGISERFQGELFGNE